MLTWAESAKRYCARPSWISRATRARSSATARPNSASPIARQTPDEQHPEGEDTKEVAREDVVARTERREHVVEVGEHDERERQRQPAVEVAAVAAVAQPEPIAATSERTARRPLKWHQIRSSNTQLGRGAFR